MNKLTKTIAALGVVAGLGVAALPLSSYAANTNVPVTVTVDDQIAISTDKNEVDFGGMLAGQSATQALSVTVYSSSNYDLKASAANGGALISSDATDGGSSKATTIPALSDDNFAGASAAFAIATTDAGNYAWKGLGSEKTLKTDQASNTTVGDITSVIFGVKLADNQAAGTYEGNVTFTATVHQ